MHPQQAQSFAFSPAAQYAQPFAQAQYPQSQQYSPQQQPRQPYQQMQAQQAHLNPAQAQEQAQAPGYLENGPWLSALKLLLCIDLMFTYPIVFSSGRQILENAIIGPENIPDNGDDNDDSLLARAGIVAGGVGATFALAQIGGFGVVANLVGGVAQGTLAFIMPPAIALALMEEGKEEDKTERIAQYIFVGSFGTAVVGAVTYFTLSS